jgi:hypothetical protein
MIIEFHGSVKTQWAVAIGSGAFLGHGFISSSPRTHSPTVEEICPVEGGAMNYLAFGSGRNRGFEICLVAII